MQNEYNGMEAKYIEERVELDAKYQKLYEPLYAKVIISCWIAHWTVQNKISKCKH